MSHHQDLSAADLQRVMTVYRRLLAEHRDHLNALNVYPVPDADTGTNLCSTLDGVVDAIEGHPAGHEMAEITRRIQRGALLGARGCSGVITSQLIGALVGSFDDVEEVDGPRLASGLKAATDAAYEAVLRPVEGTILTVIREATEAAAEVAEEEPSLVKVLEAARFAAGEALEATPDLLPVLKAAGVVDAGGSGLVLLFDAFLHVADQRPLPEAPAPVALATESTIPSGMPRYEVVARLAASAEMIDEFLAVWKKLGDESTVVVEGEDEWVCHVHTDHLEAALEAARAAGEVRDVRVTDLVGQIVQLRTVRTDEVAVVAVTVGHGLQERFLEMGASGVVAGGVAKNPSTAELLQAVESTGAETVIILPNDEKVLPATEQVAQLTARDVMVVPTLSVPAGIAAMRRFDPSASDGGAAEMAAAAERVAAGQVTRAVRDADSPVGRIEAGRWMTMRVDGKVGTAGSLNEAVLSLLEGLAGDSIPIRIEIVTGEGAEAGATAAVRRHVAERWPAADVVFTEGGQPHFPYVIGVESTPGPDDR